MKEVTKVFGYVAKFKYLGSSLTIRNNIHGKKELGAHFIRGMVAAPQFMIINSASFPNM
jgi:hypothetical protein